MFTSLLIDVNNASEFHRLPIQLREYEEDSSDRRPRLESVDLKLRSLLMQLRDYRSTLGSNLSKKYIEFQQNVLGSILYNKELDKLHIELDPPTKDEKKQLTKAFEIAGLLNSKMKARIDEHFAKASKDIIKLNTLIEEGRSISMNDVLIIPLVIRTKEIVNFARQLEKDREMIFKPLRTYERIVNEFLESKSVNVDDIGTLNIFSNATSDNISHNDLSSGEKQILILLTQSLLKQDDPIIYIADEPELSLHIDWQVKLLESLKELGGQIQIIVATHSPDIAGRFQDHIIKLNVES